MEKLHIQVFIKTAYFISLPLCLPVKPQVRICFKYVNIAVSNSFIHTTEEMESYGRMATEISVLNYLDVLL